MNIKQDINMTRKTSELEQRYSLTKIEPLAKEQEEIKKQLEVDTSLSISSNKPVANKVITETLNNKVNKIEGKTLSSNDFTNEYKEKLDNIEENATNYTPPINSVFFCVETIDKPEYEMVGNITINNTTIYAYKKIS